MTRGHRLSFLSDSSKRQSCLSLLSIDKIFFFFWEQNIQVKHPTHHAFSQRDFPERWILISTPCNQIGFAFRRELDLILAFNTVFWSVVYDLVNSCCVPFQRFWTWEAEEGFSLKSRVRTEFSLLILGILYLKLHCWVICQIEGRISAVKGLQLEISGIPGNNITCQGQPSHILNKFEVHFSDTWNGKRWTIKLWM